MGRSENMRRIRSKDTQPELALRRSLYSLGLRYRIHPRELPGKPDIVFKSKKLAVFVHGCFWHQHPGCIQASDPRTNRAYWVPKLQRNVQRDRDHIETLEAAGFRVVVLWECEIELDVEEARGKIISALRSDK